VVGYSSSTGLYLHAKAIVADYGLSTAAAEVGSMNWTGNSLDDNRELGVILADTGVQSVVETQFDADYAAAPSSSAAAKEDSAHRARPTGADLGFTLPMTIAL
jgi:phosphatidylserine/phosphatidylglycerophosphate/cardiolipin synthase-like enzyme